MNSVEPVRKQSDLTKLKKYLANNKRDLFYFVLAVNTGIRTGDLLELRVKDIKNKKIGDQIPIIEQKTGKQNFIVINKPIFTTFQEYISAYKPMDNDFIFFSRKGNKQDKHIHVFSMSRLVKQWFTDLNIKGNYGCHSFRKTWGYMQRVRYLADWSVICRRYNHSSPSTTMRYLGITSDEISNICLNEI
ncbi:MAG: tyrosine-type recombinase/integrase [Thermodesulfobacteriota bacterium]|nr:tyrosine-type recombinase/integrase [Thermodesulfobacteriota bacterium]